MIKLASWNVNSLKIRLEQVLAWLATSTVDILALQEIKLIDEQFPQDAFRTLGYYVSFSGQKTYNGVAIISRFPLTDVITDIPSLADPQRRILAASIGSLRLINLYVPNGAALTSEKYLYKLDWLQKVSAYIKEQLTLYPELAVVGDFNIAPEDIDVHDPIAWQDQVLVSPLERQAFTQLLNLGLVDSFRHYAQTEQAFSWWDYRAASFRRNLGLRIDHILLSQALHAKCLQAGIDKEPRKIERPSDHTPVWVTLKLE